jgi:hypothetical protein
LLTEASTAWHESRSSRPQLAELLALELTADRADDEAADATSADTPMDVAVVAS